jgi:catechol 2,3-dioxygenase-like lactoylglutathione lyase family enzyme
MINGAHLLLYSRDADADRAFFSEVLGLASVDAGRGWLIFGLPASELAVHPTEDDDDKIHSGHKLLGAHLYFMCDDLRATIRELASRDVKCTEVEDEPWGIRTTISLPSGGEVGLYQPLHPTALHLGRAE